MAEQLVLAILILSCTLPFILPFREYNLNLNRYIGLLSLYHVIYVGLLFLPITFTFLSIFGTTMNWSGKLIAILFSLVFYFSIRKYFSKHDYVLSLPSKQSIKKVLIVGLVTLIVMCVLTLVFSKGKMLNAEKLSYQLTIPGIDEELWRGILIGLLVIMLKDVKFKFGHPVVWITAAIFAFGHSLHFQNWTLGFSLDAFIISGVLGYILGWMTIYSRSILPALIFHNLINFSTNLIEMVVL